MGWVTLKFKLPEEREEFNLAQQGAHYKIVLDELDNWLRALIKYQDLNSIELTRVREKMVELLTEQGIK